MGSPLPTRATRRARAFYERAVELGRADHSRWTVADAQVSIMVNLHRVRPYEALQAGRAAALRAFEELGDPYGKCAALRGLALTARIQGRLETALDLHAESHRPAVSHNLPLLEIADRVSEAERRLALGRTRDAIGILELALVDSRRPRASRLESKAAALLAGALEQSGQSSATAVVAGA
ncbi:hypothetical protein AQI95_19485 [Streptomyces yokosukanensis]|uniref:MalT-like TPR region domain-containing protein n=1 Tax=Streptomyces yokosukanensis TaxID=67386 RepID=A0A101P416_9ACTN|nr:hypothetical protein [Streptomyces yokosukanensis]KUN04531.1 hypothetical protein AQI95_19485 [Streptomyces yokosukanensis]